MIIVVTQRPEHAPGKFAGVQDPEFEQWFSSLGRETDTEINNTGFALQRNPGNNYWQIVSFILSSAVGCDSNAVLA